MRSLKKGGNMKRVVFVTLFLVLCLRLSAYAADTGLLDMRNKIFAEANNIQLLLSDVKRNSLWKDAVLINSMWDSCIMTMTQLDAYFSMLGIFNTIKDKDVNETSTKYLIDWLNEMKKANDMNITSLQGMSAQSLDSETKLHMDSLKTYFAELTKKIEGELNKISLIKKSLKIK